MCSACFDVHMRPRAAAWLLCTWSLHRSCCISFTNLCLFWAAPPFGAACLGLPPGWVALMGSFRVPLLPAHRVDFLLLMGLFSASSGGDCLCRLRLLVLVPRRAFWPLALARGSLGHGRCSQGALLPLPRGHPWPLLSLLWATFGGLLLLPGLLARRGLLLLL